MANTQYKPDYGVAPGDVLLDIIEARDISQADLAKRCGRPEKTISGIINGNTGIMIDTAMQFERTLGIKAEIWLALEGKYKIWQQRLEEEERLSKCAAWVKQFPFKDMKRRELVSDCSSIGGKTKEILSFFGVNSIEVFDDYVEKPIAASLRHSPVQKSNRYALHTWLREGEMKANQHTFPEYSKEKFQRAVKAMRGLTTLNISEAVKEAKQACAESGVALVVIPAYRGVAASGIARWVNQNKLAVIQLSVRGKTDDKLWFSFFHECAHILKHPKRKIFIDGMNEREDTQEELEADKFAQDILIPSKHYADFLSAEAFSRKAIQTFAKNISIAPGIVVGRLQKEGLLKYSQLNSLKKRLVVSTDKD